MLDVTYDGQAVKAALVQLRFQGQTLEVAEFDLDVESARSATSGTVKDKVIGRLLHADITLHVNNTVQNHLDEPGSGPGSAGVPPTSRSLTSTRAAVTSITR